MKAKLSKEGGGYDLYRIDEDGKRVTFASTQYYKQKLSLKNCQAIERGYDLDELVKIDLVKEKDLDFTDESSFRRGFLKALEILGDKKFSEENMEDAYYFGSKKLREEYLDFIKTFQQTEWEVEIVGEESHEYNMCSNPKDHVSCLIPKLDADGCLILKRI